MKKFILFIACLAFFNAYSGDFPNSSGSENQTVAALGLIQQAHALVVDYEQLANQANDIAFVQLLVTKSYPIYKQKLGDLLRDLNKNYATNPHYHLLKESFLESCSPFLHTHLRLNQFLKKSTEDNQRRESV
mgnify:CR=1 FL=1